MATKKKAKTMKGKTNEFYLVLPDLCSEFKKSVDGTKINYPHDNSTYMDSVHVLPASVDIEKAFNDDVDLEDTLDDISDYGGGSVAIVKVKITDIFFAEKYTSLKITRPKKKVAKKKVAKKKTTKK